MKGEIVSSVATHDSKKCNKLAELHRSIIVVYCVSILCMLNAGGASAYSVYNPNLKSLYNYSQPDMELMGTLLNIGAYLGPVVGIIVALTTPRLCGIISGLCSFTGYVIIAAAIKFNITNITNYPVAIGLLLSISGFGSGLMSGLCVATNVNNISIIKSKYLATAVSLLTCCMASTGSIYAAIYSHLFDSDLAGFLFLIACLLLAVSSVGAIFMKKLSVQQLQCLNPECNACSLNNDSTANPNYITTTSNHIIEPVADIVEIDNSVNNRIQPLLNNSNTILIKPSVTIFNRVWIALLLLIRNVYAWILFSLLLFMSGAGLVEINNIGNIVQSLNGGAVDHDYSTKLLTVFSVCNIVGRLIMLSSDFIKIRRGYWLLLSCLFMCIGHTLNAEILSSKSDMIIPMVFIGLSYGSLWCIIHVITAEIFIPADNFPMNIGWIAASTGIASAIFNSVAGKLYDMNNSNGDNNCVGTACYHSTYILCSASSAVACLLAIPVIFKTTIPNTGKKI
jgi:hypothetical protein